MKAETLEKLKTEATEALRRYLCGFDAGSAQSAATMLSVLTTLDGMKAEDEGQQVFACARTPWCNYKSSVTARGELCEGCQDEAARVMTMQQRQNEAATLAGALNAYAMPKSDGVGVVTTPRPPTPCPVLGCTYVSGHNAPCTVASRHECVFTSHTGRVIGTAAPKTRSGLVDDDR